MPALKIAIVCGQLTALSDEEKVVLALHNMLPAAPIYAAFYNPSQSPALAKLGVQTTFLQKLPLKLQEFCSNFHYIINKALQQINLSEFDVILCLNVNPPVKNRAKQAVISYCLNSAAAERAHSQPTDVFVVGSESTKNYISERYGKVAAVVHPPVDVERFTPPPFSERLGYILWGRHLPGKRFDLAIKACNQLGAPLTVVGHGPETELLKKLAGPTIAFTGRLSDEELARRAHKAKAFLLPGAESFCISAVEAMAAGVPVIAYAKNDAPDMVQDGETGVLFNDQTVEALIEAIKKADALEFRASTLHRKSKRFAKTLFYTKIKKLIHDAVTRP